MTRPAGYFLEWIPRLRGEVVGWIVEVEQPGRADLTVLVELLEAVIHGEGDTKWIRRETNALGPLAKEPDVGGHRLEGERQTRLDETDHSTEAALDVLSALAP